MNVPRLPDLMQSQLVDEVRRTDGLREVLLIGENEDDGVTQFVVTEDVVECVRDLLNSFGIVRVDDKDQTLRVLIVYGTTSGPQRACPWNKDAQCFQRGRIICWPPTSQTVKVMLLYDTVSTLKPMVGIVVTTSPSFSSATTSGLA